MVTRGRHGTVKQSTNGTWHFVVDIGDDVGGRRQTRRRGFPTKRAAQVALSKVLRDFEQRAYVAPSRQTLAMFLTEDWLPAIEATIRPSTFDSYARNLRNHVASSAIGDVPLQRVDAAHLNRLYADLLAGGAPRDGLSRHGPWSTCTSFFIGPSATPSAGTGWSATPATRPTRRSRGARTAPRCARGRLTRWQPSSP